MKPSRVLVAGVLLTAFVGFAFAAGLPHVHSDGAAAHDCFACRAHSAQPTIEPTAASAMAPPAPVGTHVPAKQPDLFSQNLFFIPASRAPPVPA